MQQAMPMIEARNKLTILPETFEKNRDLDAVAVTRRGKPVLAVMSWELFESLQETLEVVSDKVLMADLRNAIRDVRKGKTVSWAKVKRDLKL